jgi:hypothetical protein
VEARVPGRARCTRDRIREGVDLGAPGADHLVLGRHLSLVGRRRARLADRGPGDQRLGQGPARGRCS